MNLSALQATLVSLVGSVASIAVGFGAFSATKEQLVVSAAGTLISLGFQLYTELERNTKVKAAVANNDASKLSKLAGN